MSVHVYSCGSRFRRLHTFARCCCKAALVQRRQRPLSGRSESGRALIHRGRGGRLIEEGLVYVAFCEQGEELPHIPHEIRLRFGVLRSKARVFVGVVLLYPNISS